MHATTSGGYDGDSNLVDIYQAVVPRPPSTSAAPTPPPPSPPSPTAHPATTSTPLPPSSLGIIIVACALVDLISAFVMFRRVAKEPKSRYKRVLWTILALVIGPLVWFVWYCRQRGRGQSAESYGELVELPGTSTATEIAHPSAAAPVVPPEKLQSFTVET